MAYLKNLTVKSTYCSSRVPKISSQNPGGFMFNSNSKGSNALFWPPRTMHAYDLGLTLSHVKQINKTFKEANKSDRVVFYCLVSASKEEKPNLSRVWALESHNRI